MKVLITGASGFLGRHTLAYLRELDVEITAISSRPQPPQDGVTWVQADFLRDDLTPLLAEAAPDRVIHLAWECGQYKEPVHLDWLRASLRWLDAIHAAGCKHLLTAGSSMEYRWSESPCHENTGELAPSTMYGHAKLALGKLCAAYCERVGMGHAHTRVFFVCGVGEPRTRLIPGAIQALRSGEPFTCNAGHAWRDYLDVEEVGKTIAKLSDHEYQGTINVASGRAIQLSELMTAVGNSLGRPDLIRFGQPPADSAKDIALADVTKLHAALGYTPGFNSTASIEKMVASMTIDQSAGVQR